MGSATSVALAQLADRIEALEVSLRLEFREGIADASRHTDARVEEAEGHADEKFEEARHHTDAQFTEVRRHTQVLVESLREDIQMLAEGFATISVKLDSLQR